MIKTNVCILIHIRVVLTYYITVIVYNTVLCVQV